MRTIIEKVVIPVEFTKDPNIVGGYSKDSKRDIMISLEREMVEVFVKFRRNGRVIITTDSILEYELINMFEDVKITKYKSLTFHVIDDHGKEKRIKMESKRFQSCGLFKKIKYFFIA